MSISISIYTSYACILEFDGIVSIEKPLRAGGCATLFKIYVLMILPSAGIQIESRFTLIPETAWVLAQQTFRNHPNSGANSDTTKRPFVKSKVKSKFTFFNCHQRCLQRSCSPSADSVDSGVPNHRSWRPRGCSMRPTRPEDCAMAPRWAWWAWRRQRPCCGGLDGCEDMWRLTCKLRGDKDIYVGWRQIPTERFAMDVYIYVDLHHYAANGLLLNNQRVVLGAIWLEHLWARRNRNRM